MNYRHCYHAGNFADVMKHAVLITVLEAMQRKETPFCFLDTHAGIGLYDLQAEAAQKKQEYGNGIAKLFASDDPVFQTYLSIVKKYNNDGALTHYPGSPLIAAECLRFQDEMILCELHPSDHQTLKQNCLGFRMPAAIHHMDGYLGLKAFLPPKQKRGVVLIDPPFEITNEFDVIVNALERALKHWRSGHFIIWYPIKDMTSVKAFHRQIRLLTTETLTIHFSLNQNVEAGKLSSCGVLLINPPWKVREVLEASVLPKLASGLDAAWEVY